MKQSNFKQTPPSPIADRMMHISADSKEELNEVIDEHWQDGWQEKSRTISHDGTFMATLVRNR